MTDGARVHVLVAVNSLCVGGAEKHAVTLLNTLDTRRFRLSLVYLKDEAPLLPQVLADRAEGGVFCLGVSRRIDMQAVRRLARHLRDEDIDVVMCTNTYSLLYAWLARLAGPASPRIIEVFHSTELGSLREEMQMLFYRPWILAADRLVYVCDNQRRYWRSRALRARRDTVIHNGIDIAHFNDGYSAEEKVDVRASLALAPTDYVVGLCAAMRPEKAHADLLIALARLRDQGVPVRALLIGDGPQRSAIEGTIDALDLRAHVRITGFQADVRPLIAACDVMAITSHRVETFSIAALEAMALGKPMVMTRIGGAAEQVEHGRNGFLYRRGDISALCDALRKLRDAHLRLLMGAQARDLVAHRFSQERMVEQYARLFESVAPKRGARGRKQGNTSAEARHAG